MTQLAWKALFWKPVSSLPFFVFSGTSRRRLGFGDGVIVKLLRNEHVENTSLTSGVRIKMLGNTFESILPVGTVVSDVSGLTVRFCEIENKNDMP